MQEPDIRKIAEVLTKAQQGNEKAKNELIKMMVDDGCMKQISRYINRNRLLEPDDVRSEFWFGVARAIPKAKPNLGNPLRFLAQCGVWRVISALRHRLRNGVRCTCNVCGRHAQLNRRIQTLGCPRCNSTDITTTQVTTSIELSSEKNFVYKKQLTVTHEFEQQLNGRELDVYKLIMEGASRDKSSNYLKEIAQELGISAPCVAIYLRRIRTKLTRYMEDK